jgi:hypothetical protein
MDLFGDPAERDEVSPFVKMLWERGALPEQAMISGIGASVLDLSGFAGDEKERLTTEAIEHGEPVIYSGRIRADDLLGEPHLLRRYGTGCIAGDIKSGAGQDGSTDLSKPKLQYGVQVALYTDILEQKGWSAGRSPFVMDIDGQGGRLRSRCAIPRQESDHALGRISGGAFPSSPDRRSGCRNHRRLRCRLQTLLVVLGVREAARGDQRSHSAAGSRTIHTRRVDAQD